MGITQDVIENQFLEAFAILQRRTYDTATKHGFQDYQANALYVPTKLSLIMSEAAEALEAHRQNQDGELGHELADIVIRTMDLAQSLNIDLATEIVKKAKFNEDRPFKHGNKRY